MGRAIIRCSKCNSDDVYYQHRVRANPPKHKRVLDFLYCAVCDTETEPKRRNEIIAKITLAVARGARNLQDLRDVLPEYTSLQLGNAVQRAIAKGRIEREGELKYEAGHRGPAPRVLRLPKRNTTRAVPSVFALGDDD